LVKLILLAAIGRLPSILVGNLVGAGASVLDPSQLVILIIVLVAIILAFKLFGRSVEEKMFSTVERIGEGKEG
jgi:hypothetical protein